jgi:hypothetical protein
MGARRQQVRGGGGGSQRCPVRCMIRQAAEVPINTALYAAWHTASKAMHRHSRPAAGEGEPAVLADAAPAAGAGDTVIAMSSQLRPFKAHILSFAGGCEFCTRCFAKAPRYSGGRAGATGTRE